MSMNLWKIEQLCKENFALGAASRDAEIAELKRKMNEPVLLSEWQQLKQERDQLREQVSALQRSINFDQIQAQQETIDQLREQVTLLRDAFETLSSLGILHVHNGQPSWIFPLSVKARVDKALDATEPK